MWPFDDEEETSKDSNVAEFDLVTSYIFEDSQDPEVALGSMLDAYSSYQFEDKEKANALLEERSGAIRQKFGIKSQFDFDATVTYAPINFNDVIGEGDSDESRAMDQIKKWEQQNKEIINTSDDPIYIQNRTRLSRDIEKASVAQRRMLYGDDDYIVPGSELMTTLGAVGDLAADQAVRAAQGAISPIASLFGADSVTDWFAEHTDPDGVEIAGKRVGGDDSYISAISGGLGSAAGAVAAGLGTAGVGTVGYLAAAGAGAVRDQYEESRLAGGSVGEATDAALIEGASQIGQTLVGGRIYGKVVNKLLGKSVSQLGTRVFPKVVGAATLEGTTESIGQVASNYATNRGQGTDIDLLEDVDNAFVGGFAAGGVATGGAEVYASRFNKPKINSDINSSEDITTDPVPDIPQEQADVYINSEGVVEFNLKTEEAQVQELQNVIEEQEMQIPPPYETIREESKVVNLEEPEVVAIREDGSKIVASGDTLHNVLNEEAGQYETGFKTTMSVTPEVAAKLIELEKPTASAPDGTGFNLFTEDGKLYVKSKFIPPDFVTSDTPITTDKTGLQKVEIPATSGIEEGKIDVQVNELNISNNVNTAKYSIGKSPIKNINSETGDPKKRKEGQWVKRFRETLTDVQKEAFGVASVTFEDFGKGPVKVETPLILYDPTTNKAQGIEARRIISERGYPSVLAELDSLYRANAQDNANASVVLGELKRTQAQAQAEGNYALEDAMTPLIQQATRINDNVTRIFGQGQQVSTTKAQTAIGGLPLKVDENITEFNRKARQEAEAETAEEFGLPKVSLSELQRDLKIADENVAVIEKEIGDPIEIAKADIDARISIIDDQIQKTPEKAESLNKKKVKLVEQKERVNKAQTEGRIKVIIEPETKAKLDDAKKTQLRIKSQLDRAENKLREKLAKFPIQDQETLRELYKVRSESIVPTESMKLDEAILKLESKINPITPSVIQKLRGYWRGNVLSDINTAMRNLGSFLSIAGTGVSYGATDIVSGRALTGKRTKFAEFAKGVKQSITQTAFNDAVEILTGEKHGRLGLDPDSNNTRNVKPLRFDPRIKIGPIPMVNPVLPLLSMVELARRVMSVNDTVAHGAANYGHARVAALMAAEKGLDRAGQIKAVEDAIMGTSEKRAEVKANIEARVKALETVGIKTSPRQQRIMFNEAMELNRGAKLNAIGERGGNEAIYVGNFAGNHDGVLGVMAQGMNHMTGLWKIKAGGQTIKPLQEIIPIAPFLNTAAGIGNWWLSYTPLGLRGVQKSRNASKEARATAFTDATAESTKNELQGLAKLTPEEINKRMDDADIYQVQATEYFGRVMVGTSVMLGFAGILASQNEDKPWVKWNGPIPPGKAREWASQGRKPFTLEVGGEVLTKDALGPLTMAFAGADIIHKAVKTNQNIPRTAYILGAALMNTLADVTFLKNAKTILDSFNGSDSLDENLNMSEKAFLSAENAGEGLLANSLQPLIPGSGFLKNIYRWADGAPTETYNNFTAKMMNNIPFGRDISGADKMLNEYGEPIEYTPWQRGPGAVFITTKNDDPVSQWRVKTGYKISAAPLVVKLNKGETDTFGDRRTLKLGDAYRDILTEAESTKVLKYSGPLIKEYLKGIIYDPAFSTYNENNQKKINEKVANIRAKARELVLDK